MVCTGVGRSGDFSPHSTMKVIEETMARSYLGHGMLFLRKPMEWGGSSIGSYAELNKLNRHSFTSLLLSTLGSGNRTSVSLIFTPFHIKLATLPPGSRHRQRVIFFYKDPAIPRFDVFILQPIEVWAENRMLDVKSSKRKQIGVSAAVNEPAGSTQATQDSIWVTSNCADNDVRNAVSHEDYF